MEEGAFKILEVGIWGCEVYEVLGSELKPLVASSLLKVIHLAGKPLILLEIVGETGSQVFVKDENMVDAVSR